MQYPANMNITVSVPTGVKDTTARLTSQMKACPEQKFAIVGYSQGAGVMHAAAVKFDSAMNAKIAAAVMFGDPGFKSGGAGKGFMTPSFPAALQAKLKENCNPGDPVSNLTPLSDAELGYSLSRRYAIPRAGNSQAILHTPKLCISSRRQSSSSLHSRGSRFRKPLRVRQIQVGRVTEAVLHQHQRHQKAPARH
jgi:hypothetical protein